MLDNIFCVPDEKNSPKHVDIVSFHVYKIWRGKKKKKKITEITANPALDIC